MNRHELLFFSTPGEQSKWLSDLLSQNRMWCLAWDPSKNSGYQSVDSETVTRLDWAASKEYGFLLFIGNVLLASEPIWETSGKPQRELDFIRSRAIEFIPSIFSGDSLLMGQLSILPPSKYSECGIDPKPLVDWFQEVCSSFKESLEIRAKVIQRTSTGAVKKWHEILVSPEAVANYDAGRTLKQFAEGTVLFDLDID